MKIYFYLRHFPPYGDKLNNGLRKAIHGLASGLIANGAEVTVLSEGSASKNSSFKTEVGYTIECFVHPIQSRPSFKISPGLQQYVQNNIQADSLVILNGILYPSIYSMSRLLKKKGVSYVVAPHDVYHPSMMRKNVHLKLPYWYLLEKRVLQQAKGIQILDTSQSKWLKNLGITTPIFTTPNGFSPIDVNLESQLEWTVDKAPKLFYFGRLDAHHKGLDNLLNAFSRVTRTFDAQLVFQGPDGGDRNKLENLANKLLIEEKVSFLKPEYNIPASSVIANYDIFCLPSRFEGFGLSALEAMLAGRVLLVSSEAGIATYVQASGCGIVVKPRVSEIEAGLVELFRCRSQWKEMGLRGRRYVLEHLSWENIASDALEKYNNLNLSV